jgi:endonuclease-3 related protein
LETLFAGPTPEVRRRLLAISGIGPETADSMLLYAGGHASFVVDAYTRRIFSRHGWCAADASYDDLQQLCETALRGLSGKARVDFWGDYHAQLVAVAKGHCHKPAPACANCPLETLLPPKHAPAIEVKRRKIRSS